MASENFGPFDLSCDCTELFINTLFNPSVLFLNCKVADFPVCSLEGVGLTFVGDLVAIFCLQDFLLVNCVIALELFDCRPHFIGALTVQHLPLPDFLFVLSYPGLYVSI